MKSRTVRNFGLVALGTIAAVAIACGSSSNDKGESFPFSTGGSTAGVDDSATRDVDIAIEQAIASVETVPSAGDGFLESGSNALGGAAGGGTSAAPAGAPQAPAGSIQSVDRKIVQTASLQLQVEEVGVSFEEVGRIAAASGGFVASSSFSFRDGDDDEQSKRRQVASVTIRVPAEVYPSVLSQLRGLADTVDYEESNASDVTEEYTDLQSRLRNLEATEAQLLRLLERADTISDILTVQDRLNNIQYEIEYVKGRLQLIGDLTDLATISVHLRPVDGALPPVDDGDGVNLGETISEAWDDSLAFLGSIAEGVLTVVVFAWWVPLVGVPAGAVAWAATRRDSRAASAVD
jgi:hypothetical protein